jgi:hypothetical protein
MDSRISLNCGWTCGKSGRVEVGGGNHPRSSGV